MALIGNFSVLHKSPAYFMSGQTASGDRANWNKPGMMRSMGSDGLANAKKTAVPYGHVSGAWLLPRTAGGIASRYAPYGEGSLAGAGAMGVNGEAALDGFGQLDATGQLVVSAVASLIGAGLLTGNVLAALLATAGLTSSGNATGAIAALGWALGALQGLGSSTVTIRANGALAASIDVAAVAELTAADISTEILDSQMVETGLSVRETLKVCLAALAGKVSGAAGTTITIRSAVDDKDRIIATVDADGNRTAVTLDVT